MRRCLQMSYGTLSHLLRVLVQHAGKALTREFLLGTLWNRLTDAQYLRVYVRRLRQKIEVEPERPHYVLTETGVGYRLRTPTERVEGISRIISDGPSTFRLVSRI